MTAENQTDARPPLTPIAPDTPDSAMNKPKPLKVLCAWALACGLGFTLAAGYLGANGKESAPMLAQWGQWPVLWMYLGFNAAYFFPFTALMAMCLWRFPVCDRRSFFAIMACAGLGLPLGLLGWGGPGILPWSLLCQYMVLLPALEAFMGPRLGVAPSLLSGWRGENPVRLAISPAPVTLVLLSECSFMLFMVLYYYSNEAFDMLVLARTGLELPLKSFEDKELVLTVFVTGYLGNRFRQVFRPSQAALVSLVYFVLTFPLASFAAWTMKGDHWWMYATPASVIVTALLFNHLHSMHAAQAKKQT